MAASRKFGVQVSTLICVFLLILSISMNVMAKSKDDINAEADKWKKKDVRDYSDVDMERLFEQWEEAEEELEPDELPEWKRPQPKLDISKLDPNNPEAMIKATKKGKTLMMFASVSGNPTEKETEQITKIWQSSLYNANMETQRYVVGANRVLFMLKDGSYAWDIKDYLVDQEQCEVVTIDGQDFPGKGSPKFEEPKGKGKAPPSGKGTPAREKKKAKKKTKSTEDNRTERKGKKAKKVEL